MFRFAGVAVSGRGRHRHNQVLPMMIFGVTALGMVMVPIGFQMLSLFAGKALLLSKMALLLASINGIKRVIYLIRHNAHSHTRWNDGHIACTHIDKFYHLMYSILLGT